MSKLKSLSIKDSKYIVSKFKSFFESKEKLFFEQGYTRFCKFYRLKKIPIVFLEKENTGQRLTKFGLGTTFGLYQPDGILPERIILVHPMFWKLSNKDWVRTTLHELIHFALLNKQEEEAEKTAKRIIEKSGLMKRQAYLLRIKTE